VKKNMEFPFVRKRRKNKGGRSNGKFQITTTTYSVQKIYPIRN
jgi:hypothetical protein